MNAPASPAIQFDPSSAHFGSSRSQKRLEDDRLLTGKGLYSDDRVPAAARPGSCSCARRTRTRDRCARPRGGARRARRGRRLVDGRPERRTASATFRSRRCSSAPTARRWRAPPRTPLADGKVYYVGQPVAAIVAETREQAQDAAELVGVEYEELPCVVRSARGARAGRAAALAARRPATSPRRCAMAMRRRWTPRSRRRRTSRDLSLHNQRLNAMPLEPRCCAGGIRRASAGRCTRRSQQPTGTRESLAAVFKAQAGAVPRRGGRPRRRLRHEDRPLAARTRSSATRRASSARPVKWRAERSEEFLAAHMGRDQHYKAELALDARRAGSSR